MTREEPPDAPEPNEQATSPYGIVAGAIALFSTGMLVGATLQALGHRVDGFNWTTFRNGGLAFLLIVTGVCGAGLLFTLLLKALYVLSPASLKLLSERRRLRSASRRVLTTIDRRHELQEEQARLTSLLQASYLYEKESARIANSQALREFQKALQSGVVRSCEVVFEHLNSMVEQYEQVVREIESSALPDADKTALLDTLSKQLNTASLDQRHRTARRMMEDAIWGVRLRKARLLSRRNPESARRYLSSVRKPDTSHRILIQIDAMLREL